MKRVLASLTLFGILAPGMASAQVLPPGVPVYSPAGKLLSSPAPAPSEQPVRVVMATIPCSTLVRVAGLSFQAKVTAANVGRLFGAALELRGASGKHVPRSVFDEAYADVLGCFSWDK